MPARDGFRFTRRQITTRHYARVSMESGHVLRRLATAFCILVDNSIVEYKSVPHANRAILRGGQYKRVFVPDARYAVCMPDERAYRDWF